MKKLLVIFLSLALIMLVGCGGSADDSSTPSDDANALGISGGKLEGIDFGLGAEVSTVKEHYSALAAEQAPDPNVGGHLHGHEDDFAYYNHRVNDGYSIIDISIARFYYLNDQEEKGIAALATDSEVFGFTPGVTTKYEVEEAIKQEGDTLNAGEEELMFLAVRQEPIIVLRYEQDDYQLDYYFYDNTLVTTVLIDTAIWNG